MSDLLRVTTPVAPKDYNLNTSVKPQAPEQVFDLGNVDYINKTNERDEQLGEQNLKDQAGAGLPQIQTAISKDPALAAALLKGVLGSNTLSALGAAGNAELLNKVTEFANEILLAPNELMNDIIRQQDEATMFSGELWSAVKDMVAELAGTPAGEEVSMAVLDFLKAASSSMARDDIINSISTSLRYLAGEAAQSREIVNLLMQTADRLSAENFGEVKNDILALVGYLEKSLLLSDRTQNLLSLITYNLSRFNGDPSALGDSFQAVLNMAPDAETADKLNMLFTKFVENSRLPSDIKLAALRDNPSASAQRSMTMLTERLAEAVNGGLENISAEQLSEELSKLTGELNVPDENTEAAAEENIPEQTAERTAEQTAEKPGLPEQAAAETAPPKETVTLKEGTDMLKKMLSPLVPNNMKGALNTLIREFEKTRDLNTLIDRLSVIVNGAEDMDKKIILAQGINLVLTQMAQAQGIQYRPPTTMENMLDFLIKNINDPSLKSLSDMTRPDMIQGLLSAPGVFTPLLHFLVPMNMDGMKAFGELWADPDADRDPATGESDNHLFLCFEIENAGYFELEVYARGKSVNAALLCPAGTERNYLPIKEMIPELAASCGYNAEKIMIEPLKRKRDLSNIFPKLNERRTGLNVRI
ncbi:MAG: hypothetical protein K2N60_11520 [Oscillospiraceae bacterium]|nr:hypothetical protein [Oscillospiraceae bacterium]